MLAGIVRASALLTDYPEFRDARCRLDAVHRPGAAVPGVGTAGHGGRREGLPHRIDYGTSQSQFIDAYVFEAYSLESVVPAARAGTVAAIGSPLDARPHEATAERGRHVARSGERWQISTQVARERAYECHAPVAVPASVGVMAALTTVFQLTLPRLRSDWIVSAIEQHNLVLQGVAGSPWQYRILSDYLIEPLIRVLMAAQIHDPYQYGLYAFVLFRGCADAGHLRPGLRIYSENSGLHRLLVSSDWPSSAPQWSWGRSKPTGNWMPIRTSFCISSPRPSSWRAISDWSSW